MLKYCPNCSRDLFFANHRRFVKFAKIRSPRKFSRLQYLEISLIIAIQETHGLFTLPGYVPYAQPLSDRPART
ncbi:MAG: hypothetical protein PV344_03690, partial [Anaplasma sp.]|nr:hypothetical protein [Anaplasma sp.]